jgi:hypothetical protein
MEKRPPFTNYLIMSCYYEFFTDPLQEKEVCRFLHAFAVEGVF